MYYEEKVIDGKLMFRNSPNGEWYGFTYEALTKRLVAAEAVRPEVEPITGMAAMMADGLTISEVVRRNLRMALDSREFYELSQAYRHSKEWTPRGDDINPVVEAWEALKQYVIDNSLPSSQKHGPEKT